MNPQPPETPNSCMEVCDRIIAILDRSTHAVSFKHLLKELCVRTNEPHDKINAALHDLVASEKIFAWGTKARPAFWNRDPMVEVRVAILSAVKIDPHSAAQLKAVAQKAFSGLKSDALDSLINALVAEKALFECSPARKGGKPRYAPEPPAATSLDDVILQRITRQRLSASGILAEVSNVLPDTTEAELLPALHRLEKAGHLFRHPPIKKSLGLKWARSRPNLAAQFTALTAIEKKRAMLLECGFSRDAVDSAIRSKLSRSVVEFRVPGDLSERILVMVRASRLPQLSIPALRSLINCSKLDFDLAVLRLRNSGRAHLVEHEHSATLTDDQRKELVSEDGRYFYSGITHSASRSSGFLPAL